MANNKSQEKRIRQDRKRRIHNRIFRNRARTFVKKARAAMTSHKLDISSAEIATMQAVRDLDMLASKGIIHKRNAARRKSRLMKQLAALKKQHQA
ncbi:MAG: 30S ribosomal protein S20 [Anaerolineae bacterium]|nr:30S ribosomal protein S20 [Anaerolineae bacterium]MDW8172469.1 30S ribosomal protein S20 [Anaerolineae bacterium]